MNVTVNSSSAQRLAELTQRVKRELDMLAFPTKPWLVSRKADGQHLYDVLIVGGGQSGLVLGHLLKRRQIHNILVLDRNPEGSEGVWDTYARNYEMRSPKEVMGAELGLASLSIQSYIEARHGPGAWESFTRVPRRDWMDYLRWYRGVTGVPVRNDANVVDIDYDADGVTLRTEGGEALRARFVVLANGMDGGGAWTLPSIITDNLPADRYNHTSDALDLASFSGKRVGVLGAGASAFDIAVMMLQNHAARVNLFMRRSTLPMIDIARELETAAILDHAHELADDTKWAISAHMSGLSQCPAEHHFNVAFEFANFDMHLGSPWNAVAMDGDEIVVTTPKAVFRLDHVFGATGGVVDMTRRPELSRIAGKAALWRDRFTPPDGDLTAMRLNFPYLDRCYRFQQREPGTAPGIERIFAFNALAALSMGGMSAVAISCFKYGAPRLASCIGAALFLEQEHEVVPALAAFNKPGMVISPEIRKRIGMPSSDGLL